MGQIRLTTFSAAFYIPFSEIFRLLFGSRNRFIDGDLNANGFQPNRPQSLEMHSWGPILYQKIGRGLWLPDAGMV